MRVGIYGGSFDPIHDGHVRPILEAREALDLERVLYFPTARPPHKEGRLVAPAHARYTMVEMALLHAEGLEASAFELRQDRPSYTFETLEHLAHLWPRAELVLLLGGDAFLSLPTWRRWRSILAKAHLGVLLRPGWDVASRLAEGPPELAAAVADGKVSWIENRPIDVSSSEIRRRLRSGGGRPAHLSPLVLHYIRKYGLYRAREAHPGAVQDAPEPTPGET